MGEAGGGGEVEINACLLQLSMRLIIKVPHIEGDQLVGYIHKHKVRRLVCVPDPQNSIQK